MNIFNRIVMVVLILLAGVFITGVCLFPDDVILNISAISNWLDSIRLNIALIDHLILIGIAFVLDLILVIILALELYKPGAKQVRIQKVEGGEATITVDSIKQRLAFYIDGLEDVVNVTPRVQIKKNQVEVEVEIKTSAVVNVPSKASEVVDIIKMIVVETMGLELRGEPRVKIRTGSFRYVPARPAPPSIPASAPEKKPEPRSLSLSTPAIEPAAPSVPEPMPETFLEPEPATTVMEEE
ncbi:MAG: hypothetical protein JXA42_08560 [Anaerolineales bacterium]|nr:hypothetical protein [Anaerolineales bacterium]